MQMWVLDGMDQARLVMFALRFREAMPNRR